MNNNISPKYQMRIIDDINNRLFQLYQTYKNVEYYIEKWHEIYDNYGYAENFQIFYKDGTKKIDVIKTLHSIDGETLLKIAVDLGLETPDFIPCIPTFKNELKTNYEIASQTFEKAYKSVVEEPDIAIGLAYSTLESIIKTILKDKRITFKNNEKETLPNLIKSICDAFNLRTDNSFPVDIKTIASSLIKCSKAIEDLRSDKTRMHGPSEGKYIVSDSNFAYFVVNSISTIGLFFINCYKTFYQREEAEDTSFTQNNVDILPF